MFWIGLLDALHYHYRTFLDNELHSTQLGGNKELATTYIYGEEKNSGRRRWVLTFFGIDPTTDISTHTLYYATYNMKKWNFSFFLKCLRFC